MVPVFRNGHRKYFEYHFPSSTSLCKSDSDDEHFTDVIQRKTKLTLLFLYILYAMKIKYLCIFLCLLPEY